MCGGVGVGMWRCVFGGGFFFVFMKSWHRSVSLFLWVCMCVCVCVCVCSHLDRHLFLTVSYAHLTVSTKRSVCVWVGVASSHNSAVVSF